MVFPPKIHAEIQGSGLWVSKVLLAEKPKVKQEVASLEKEHKLKALPFRGIYSLFVFP